MNNFNTIPACPCCCSAYMEEHETIGCVRFVERL